ncbi:MAG: hypothetical protein Sylvanvirus6_12 [Sylvanvirus sp.]|uniref:HTTM domain-containing protein n=1 Tax=Sylvanvirus sp. TaxID=2487774 RepID=A0A3G5AJL3_9VIRU|nr:MAG: hypothetical protein Sylvanvirus6_12 [Sylvanvirus sp.]
MYALFTFKLASLITPKTFTSSSITSMEFYSAPQLHAFVFVFGLYLSYHFVDLIPYAHILFSKQGMIPDVTWSPTHGYFPNLLNVIDHSSMYIQLYLGTAVILSQGMAYGPWILNMCQRHFQGLVFLHNLHSYRILLFNYGILWYIWASLLNRNIFILNPGLAYVGYLLLALTLICPGNGMVHRITIGITGATKVEVSDRLKLNSKVMSWIYYGTWILLAIGYTISGMHKLLHSPSWVSGDALKYIYESPLARDTFLVTWLLTLPRWMLQIATWGSLVLEISFLPLGLFKRTRKLYWFSFLALHVGVLATVSFSDLTIGVFLAHLFIFDIRWVVSKS